MRTAIGNTLSNNKKVMENYFFMTVLQILNMCFYLLIYPFLIRTLGQEGYGLYAYAASMVFLFVTFVNFGFDLPAAQQVALHSDDKQVLRSVLSCVQTAKIYIEMIAVLCFAVIMLINPIMGNAPCVFWITFLQTLTFILFPQWYYQGLQKMKMVTYIQFGFRLLSLPFIFIFIKSPQDVWVFALITSLASVLGGITAWLMIRYCDGIKIYWASIPAVKRAYLEAVPFCGSNIIGVAKEQGMILMAGSFLGMADVAIYDLANKIMLIPRTIFSKLNDALYPKMVVRSDKETNRRVLLYEVVLGIGAMLCVALFGPLAVYVLGGEQMMSSYGVTVILSFTILCWLVVGVFLQFYFVPAGYTRHILYNQIVAMSSCFIVAGVGLYFWHNVYALAVAYAFSGLCEIFYCYIVAKNKRML
ncbi:MAG: oligosaccharide flippase family protein [Prevotella sp.]|nr:oligosaccharide flippase family protein [Prevotella sp.]